MKLKWTYNYLYGAGGHAKVIRDIVEANGKTVKALIDDDESINKFQELPVIHSALNIFPIIISIGNNRTRKEVVEKLNNIGIYEFDSAIYPSNLISKRAIINEGSVVMQGVIIQSEVTIGKHCIINSGSSIDHDCVIGDYVHISPHATLCGSVEVGEGSWIGAEAVVVQGIKIGKWCTIGAGSVVIKDIPDGAVAYGNPCKIRMEN